MDNIIFYTNWYYLFKPLSNVDKGRILDAIFDYVRNGTKTEFDQLDDEPLKMCFGFIVNQIDRDKEHKKYISKQRRKAGLKSASVRKAKQDKP